LWCHDYREITQLLEQSVKLFDNDRSSAVMIKTGLPESSDENGDVDVRGGARARFSFGCYGAIRITCGFNQGN
jgi:hypothetical protein